MEDGRIRRDLRRGHAHRTGPLVLTATLFALIASLFGVLFVGFLRMSSPRDDSSTALDREASSDETATPGGLDNPRASANRALDGEFSEDADFEPAGQEVAASLTAEPEELEHESLGAHAYLAFYEPVEVAGVVMDRPLCRSVTFSGCKQQFGIWVQPTAGQSVAQVSYMLEGHFEKLRGMAGISDEIDEPNIGADESLPAGMFSIYGDGDLLWQSEMLSGIGAAQGFEVDIRGIEKIALVAKSETPTKTPGMAWGNVELLASDQRRSAK